MLRKLEPFRDAFLIAGGSVVASSLFGLFAWFVYAGSR